MVSGLSSLSLFNILLFPGRNGDKSVGYINFCFFGIRFSGVKFTPVCPVKPDSLVDEEIEDVIDAVYLRFLRTTNCSGAGASD